MSPDDRWRIVHMIKAAGQALVFVLESE